jgi:hypothetical protein
MPRREGQIFALDSVVDGSLDVGCRLQQLQNGSGIRMGARGAACEFGGNKDEE